MERDTTAVAAEREADIFATGRLIAQARRLASEYRRATGRPLAGISNEVAVFDAARLMDLEPAPGGGGGYDAIGHGGREGRRVQVKGRAVFDERKGGQRIGQLNLDRQWDSLMLVLMDEEFETYAIYEAARDEVVQALSQNGSRNRRGAMSVARFKNISRLVWTRENGPEDEIWENH